MATAAKTGMAAAAKTSISKMSGNSGLQPFAFCPRQGHNISLSSQEFIRF
jgi:hypothetical protein